MPFRGPQTDDRPGRAGSRLATGGYVSLFWIVLGIVVLAFVIWGITLLAG